MTKIKLSLVPIFLVLLLIIFTRASFADEKSSYIILSPSYQEVSVGKEFKVDVVAKSDTSLVGGDIKIDYDERVLEVISVDVGEAFDTTPLKTAKDGTITITSLIEKDSELFYGAGRVATLNLKTIDAGDTSLVLQFELGATTDSNLTSAQVTDTLTKVDEGKFVVGNPFERSVGAAKRFAIKSIPIFLFLVFLGVFLYVVYRWWKYRKAMPKDVFIPKEVPLDKPPVPSQ